MKNIKKMTSDELRSKYEKILTVQDRTNGFEWLQDEISRELDKRNRAAIFKAACWCLKNRHLSNQFAAAAQYADAVVNGSDYFSTDTSHEIGSYYTKNGCPFVVTF